jgi:hypothetical protein
MRTISLRDLHAWAGARVRKALELGAITVTSRGRPFERLQPAADTGATNQFRARRVHAGYARLRGELVRGVDSTTIVSDDRHRP